MKNNGKAPLNQKTREEYLALTPGKRWNVCDNPQTTPQILDYFVNDSDPDVRIMLSRNPQTLSSTLEVLAKDPHQLVRLSVARHQNTSMESLKDLAQDSDKEVRDRASESIQKKITQ